MKKQTAVEWLVGKILTKDEIHDDYGNVIGYKLINTFTSSEDFSKYVEEANSIFEEQIKDAYWDGGQDIPIHGIQCEKYYNENYKSE